MILRWKGPFPQKADTLLQRAGYQRFRPRYDPSNESFVIPLGTGFYPRFHAYIQEDSFENVVITLHLDQTPCTYVGGNAHAGEYDSSTSPALDAEGKRIRALFDKMLKETDVSIQIKRPWYARLISRIFGG